MAYADFDFYTNEYYGDALTEKSAAKYLSLASDEIDTLTWGRLASGFPTEEAHAKRVKKAVCAIADALYLIDEQSKAALVQKDENESYTHGAVSSLSSGKESISYVTNATATSVFAAAAADSGSRNSLLCCIATRYLADVPDAHGTNLLYAGW